MGIKTVLAPSLGKNKVINGNLRFWQRNTTFSPIADLDYFADMFQWRQGGGTGVCRIDRSTDVPNDLSDYSMKVEVTTAQASMTGFDLFSFETKIEDNFMRRLYGKPVVFSFWVKSSKIGTYSGNICNHDFSRMYVFEWSVDAPNTWEKKTIKLSMDTFTDPTWKKNENGIGLQIFWNLASGPSRQTSTLESWATVTISEGSVSSNQVNFMESLGETIYISQVKFHEGPDEIDFEELLLEKNTELVLCQRYFEKSYALDTPIGSNVAFSETGFLWRCMATADFHNSERFRVEKRGVPSVTGWRQDGVLNQWYDYSLGGHVTLSITDVDSNKFSAVGSLVSNRLYGFLWAADASL